MNKRYIILVLIIIFAVVGYSYSSYKEKLKWDKYFQRTHFGAPNQLVSDYFETHSIHKNGDFIVLDLGAGNGSDSIYLLRKGFKVYAVDFSEEAIKRIGSNASKAHLGNVKLVKSSFQDLDWDSLPQFNCIIAINSISFVQKKDFDLLWSNMCQHLKPNGLIIARLFGDELSWPNVNNMTLFNKEQIKHITQNFEIISYGEKKQPNETTVEHAFNLILEKR